MSVFERAYTSSPSRRESSRSMAGRSGAGVYVSAAWVRLTEVAIRRLSWAARGPSSIETNTKSQAPRLASIKTSSSKKVRANKPRRERLRRTQRNWASHAAGLPRTTCIVWRGLETAIRNKYITVPPDCLNVSGLRGVDLDQFAQT